MLVLAESAAHILNSWFEYKEDNDCERVAIASHLAYHSGVRKPKRSGISSIHRSL